MVWKFQWPGLHLLSVLTFRGPCWSASRASRWSNRRSAFCRTRYGQGSSRYPKFAKMDRSASYPASNAFPRIGRRSCSWIILALHESGLGCRVLLFARVRRNDALEAEISRQGECFATIPGHRMPVRVAAKQQARSVLRHSFPGIRAFRPVEKPSAMDRTVVLETKGSGIAIYILPQPRTQASWTSSTVKSRRSGPAVMMSNRRLRGRQVSGSVGPHKTMPRQPTAAARCDIPESWPM